MVQVVTPDGTASRPVETGLANDQNTEVISGLSEGEKRAFLGRTTPGPRGAVFLGMAFAFGWAPCIGPVLATVLAAAAATRTAAWGAILLVCYSIGLGLPFIGLALGLQRARGSVDWLKRHGRVIEAAGGVLLVAVGVLFVTGQWRSFFIPLQQRFARLGWPPI